MGSEVGMWFCTEELSGMDGNSAKERSKYSPILQQSQKGSSWDGVYRWSLLCRSVQSSATWQFVTSKVSGESMAVKIPRQFPYNDKIVLIGFLHPILSKARIFWKTNSLVPSNLSYTRETETKKKLSNFAKTFFLSVLVSLAIGKFEGTREFVFQKIRTYGIETSMVYLTTSYMLLGLRRWYVLKFT